MGLLPRVALGLFFFSFWFEERLVVPNGLQQLISKRQQVLTADASVFLFLQAVFFFNFQVVNVNYSARM